ncbi:MAG: class I SAM-dependent methyltransferase [Chitinophagaceae bacterium]|nr:class I SAM-dependent methyltransferase [Chitinophagaceae bacterium]
MSNINDTYFDGYYKEIWRTFIPDELTVKEVDFMIPFFNLQPGDKVLDLMCGYGRHALALAQKGIAVTAVDNLPVYVNEIKAKAVAAGLPVHAELCAVLDYSATEKFNLVICMGNSLNFFNATDTAKLLANIAGMLKEGGAVLINSWSIAEIAFKNFREKGWSTIAGIKFLTDSKILFSPTRMETESTMIAPDGNTEVKLAIDYIFSLNEMESMLNKAGLRLNEVYSIPGRKKFSVGEPRAYIIAEKM